MTVNGQSKVKLFDDKKSYLNSISSKSEVQGFIEYVSTFPNMTIKTGEQYKACALLIRNSNLISQTGNNSPALRHEIVDCFVLGMDMTSTLILAIGLAFAMGYAFIMIPMLRTMSLKQGAKVTVIGDTVSIAAMETAEISLAMLIPGFMHAKLTDALFWTGLGAILPAGFAASYPTMYWTMKRGQQTVGNTI